MCQHGEHFSSKDTLQQQEECVYQLSPGRAGKGLFGTRKQRSMVVTRETDEGCLCVGVEDGGWLSGKPPQEVFGKVVEDGAELRVVLSKGVEDGVEEGDARESSLKEVLSEVVVSGRREQVQVLMTMVMVVSKRREQDQILGTVTVTELRTDEGLTQTLKSGGSLP